MMFPDAGISVATGMADGKYAVTVTSSNFARAVYVSTGSESLHFSDNFFDLLPGESKTVYAETGQDKEILDSMLETVSLSDTY